MKWNPWLKKYWRVKLIKNSIKKIRTKFDIKKWNQISRDEIKKEDSIKKMIEKIASNNEDQI